MVDHEGIEPSSKKSDHSRNYTLTWLVVLSRAQTRRIATERVCCVVNRTQPLKTESLVVESGGRTHPIYVRDQVRRLIPISLSRSGESHGGTNTDAGTGHETGEGTRNEVGSFGLHA